MPFEVRRVIAANDAAGKAMVMTDERLRAVSRGIGENITGCEMWSTNHMPVDNSTAADAPQRAGYVKHYLPYNYVGNGQGTTFRITEWAPGHAWRCLDDPSFEVLLARAEALDVPIYLHPNLPPPTVRRAYYEGLPNPAVGNALSTVGWGWHSETALHILRLALSGALDRHPGLRFIIGHMGEMLPVMLERCDEAMGADAASYLRRSISQTILDHVHVTTSGIFARPAFDALLATFGIERILFSVDYPFRPNAAGRAFLDALSLSPAEQAKLAHGNADRLLKLRP